MAGKGKTLPLRMKARLNFTRLQNQYQPGRRAKERLQAQYPQVPAWNPGGSDPGRPYLHHRRKPAWHLREQRVALSFSCAREFGSIVAQANVEGRAVSENPLLSTTV